MAIKIALARLGVTPAALNQIVTDHSVAQKVADVLLGHSLVETHRKVDLDILTPAERRVCEYLQKNRTPIQIANNLGKSPHTVNRQIASVYQKLGVSSPEELVRLLS